MSAKSLLVIYAQTAALSAWILADWFAGTDRDVDAAVAAYREGNLERAHDLFVGASVRLGWRPELEYDRGLVLLAQGDAEAARTAFRIGTESEHDFVRASSHYELGNLAFDAAEWDAAIDAYKECLRASPTHDKAKWNLELALERKKQAERDREKSQDDQQEPNDSEDQGRDEKQPEDQDKPDEDPKDPNDTQDPQDDPPEDDGGGDEQPKGDDDKSDDQAAPQDNARDKPDDSDQEPDDKDAKDDNGANGDEGDEQDKDPKSPPKQPPADPGAQGNAQAKPLDKADLDKALEQLDAEDSFLLGRPKAQTRPPKEDW